MLRPDLIIIGVGERMTARLDPVLVKHLASKGIRVEQMDTVSQSPKALACLVWSNPQQLLADCSILLLWEQSTASGCLVAHLTAVCRAASRLQRSVRLESAKTGIFFYLLAC